MKICITSEDKTLDAAVDARFGRCAFFIFYDADTGDVEAQENPNSRFQGGAGIQSGQMMAAKGVKAVLTGNVGPNAFQTMSAAGIEVYTGLSGPVRQAVEAYKSGRLKATQGPSVQSKFGTQE